MKELKKERLKTVSPIIFICWGVALLCLMTYLPKLRATADTAPIALEDVDFSQDVDELYVTGTLSAIYDCYYESESFGIPDSKKYIIPIGEARYIGLHANLPQDIPDCDALQELTFSQQSNGASLSHPDASIAQSSDSTVVSQLHVTGVLEKMSEVHLEQYHDYLHWDVMPAELQEQYLPYYLNLNATQANFEMLLMLVVLPFLIGCIILFRALAGYGQKAIRAYIKKSPNPMYTRDKIEHFLQITPEIHKLRYNRDFICNHDGTIFREIKDLIWVYSDIVQHKTYGIPSGKTHRLILGFSDGTKELVLLSSEEEALTHMKYLKDLCPDAVFGYEEYYEKVFAARTKGETEC